jgi:hypothetical protein
MKNIQQVFNLESQHNKSAERNVFINQIHNRGEGPHFLSPISKHTIAGITARTASTVYAV